MTNSLPSLNSFLSPLLFPYKTKKGRCEREKKVNMAIDLTKTQIELKFRFIIFLYFNFFISSFAQQRTPSKFTINLIDKLRQTFRVKRDLIRFSNVKADLHTYECLLAANAAAFNNWFTVAALLALIWEHGESLLVFHVGESSVGDDALWIRSLDDVICERKKEKKIKKSTGESDL